ncbi:MAG: PDZ domain-containing protein, partial [Anaerolineae bacterium]|nr:PDZ domain-containing protein [Anaerolineae bacterium]
MKLNTLRQRQFLTGLVLVLVFSAGFVAGNLQSNIQAQTLSGDVLPPADADQTFAAFWQVYNLIQKNYVEVPNQEVLVNGAIKGLIDSLDDQYSGYIEPDFFEFYSDKLSGSIEGIGVVISEIEDTGEIEVVNVMEGTPAQKVGIREGDVFIAVNGEDVTGFTYLELASRVRGEAGTTVDLTMRRGDEEINITVERARIEIPNTEAEVLEGDIGYIKLNQFTAEARRQLDERLEEIDAENLNGVILDLRGNPGGYLGSAIEIASAFIEDGVVLYEMFGDGTEQVFETDGSYTGLKTPLVILIDERSASAS